MTRDELRERAAEAHYNAVNMRVHGHVLPRWENLPDRHRDWFRSDMDAALAAIAEAVPHAVIISDGCHRLADRSTGIPSMERGWRDTANLLRALAEGTADV